MGKRTDEINGAQIFSQPAALTVQRMLLLLGPEEQRPTQDQREHISQTPDDNDTFLRLHVQGIALDS